jgi:HD-like signal output (HDOD) protein
MDPAVPARHTAGQGGLAALEFLQALSGELAKGTVDLPCFPNVVIKIREALSDPQMTADTVARMIGAEPRLSARLLQMANSAAVNPAGKRVSDLKTAITRLGQQMVQSAAMAYAVHQLKRAPSLTAIAEPLTGLWKRSITTASICQVVARRTSVSPDEAFLTGLLHGIGQLYIMVRAVGYETQLDGSGAFAELIADWHPVIGQMVLENWDMDAAIAQAVKDQNSSTRSRGQPLLTDILVVAVMLADVLITGSKRGAEIEQSECFRAIGLKPEDCGLIMTHASYQLDSLLEVLGC